MNFNATFRLAATAVLSMAALLPLNASAALGSKPITVIIPLSAGGPNDAELKLYSSNITGKLLPNQFVMDFKPGAGGTIGAAFVARSAPDGHTLLMISSSFTAVPAMYKDLPFDTMKDFTHISQASLKNFVLGVPATLPIKNMREYLAYVKANPEKLNFGTSGSGGSMHLGGAWLNNLTSTKTTFVHYKGSSQVVLDLVGGRVDVTVLAIPQAEGLMKSGKVQALAVMGSNRVKSMPDVPTINEIVPGFIFESYIGFSGPAGMPADVVKQLNEAFAKVVRMPEVVKALEAQASLPVGGTPEQFTRTLQTETERWKKVARDNNITLQD